MALAGFEMTDIRSRGLDPPGDVFLCQIESASAFADDCAESSLSRFSHRSSFAAADRRARPSITVRIAPLVEIKGKIRDRTRRVRRAAKMFARTGGERANLEPILAERPPRTVVVMDFQLERGGKRARVAQFARDENGIAVALEMPLGNLYRLHVRQQSEHDSDERHRSQQDEKPVLAHGRRGPPRSD